MKNTLFKKILLGLIILISTVNISLAGDSISIAVSCSIPAIPGVNVPMIEEASVRTDQDQVAQKEIKAQEETKEEAPQAVSPAPEKEMLLTEEKTNSVIMQTLYSR